MDDLTKLLKEHGVEMFQMFSGIKHVLERIQNQHGDLRISEISDLILTNQVADILLEELSRKGTLEDEFAHVRNDMVLKEVEQSINNAINELE